MLVVGGCSLAREILSRSIAQTVEKRRRGETRCPSWSDTTSGSRKKETCLMHIYGYHERHNCEVYFIK